MSSPPLRFQLLARLGSGGMGVVHEAYDHVRNEVVAIKTLDHFDPWRLFCLKNEFRTLANVVHPNLVATHELIQDGEHWTLVLERVAGRTLHAFILDCDENLLAEAHRDAATHRRTVPQIRPSDRASSVRPSAAHNPDDHRKVAANVPDYNRIREVFRGMTAGVAALHSFGILHRDLKPSNVLVEDTGRVVILDFGLAVDREHVTHPIAHAFSGTVEYVAPERHRGAPATAASDWYSMGVMMYEVLTGQLPYFVHSEYVAYREHEPGAPHELDPRVPRDLSELTVALLRVNPSDRPMAHEILARLGAPRVDFGPFIHGEQTAFFGRVSELGTLDALLADAASGALRYARVVGESGIGKSALLEAFARRSSARPDALVLRSRCLAGETSPYKGIDGLVDAIALHMLHCAPCALEASLVVDCGALLAMFPVLGRVPQFATSARGAAQNEQDRSGWRYAVNALGCLLQALSRSHTLVLCVDDVQWGDEDGAHILRTLVTEKQVSRALVVVASHPAALGSELPWQDVGCTAEGANIVLSSLPVADCELWVRSMMKNNALNDLVPRIVQMSAGHPMFITQLMQSALELRSLDHSALELRELVASRMAGLSLHDRRLLEVLALVARPLAMDSLRAIDEDTQARSLRSLLGARWVRASGAPASGTFEIAHDRLRTLIVSSVDPGLLASRHAQIAHGLAREGNTEPELLSAHFEHAGLKACAARHALRAGQEALALMAFVRAATMFERAQGLHRLTGEELFQSVHGLASAYQGLGYGSQSATAWLQCARLTQIPSLKLEFERRAAEQWLTCGQIEKGLDVLEHVVHATGSQLPRTRPRALAELFYYSGRLAWRDARPSVVVKAADAERNLRTDSLFAASRAFSMLDVEFALSLQTRFHWYAEQSGDPERLALALAWSACFRGVFKGPDDERFKTTIARAEQLAEGFPDGLAPGFCAMVRGATDVLSGRYAPGVLELDRAQALFAGRRSGSAWERMFTRVVLAAALGWSGQFARLESDMKLWLADADDRKDAYTATMLRLRAFNGIRYLVRDDPRALLTEVSAQMEHWPKHRMTEDLSRRYAAWLGAFGELACGNQGKARAHLQTLERGALIGRQLLPYALRAESELLKGLVFTAGGRPAYAEVERAIARMEADSRPYGQPFAWTLRAAVALRKGASAEGALVQVENAARQGGLFGLAASAAWMCAQQSSTPPSARQRDAKLYLIQQGVVNVDRFVRFWFAPWTLETR